MIILAVAEASRTRSHAEETIRGAVEWMELGIEVVGATMVALGALIAVVQLARVFLGHDIGGFLMVRLTFARYLALALEFQLAADVLSTAIAPSWEQIGKLGAIAVIRTGLNFFLMMEMNREEQERKTAKEQAGLGKGS
jgi:uncharacterized membrane protein